MEDKIHMENKTRMEDETETHFLDEIFSIKKDKTEIKKEGLKEQKEGLKEKDWAKGGLAKGELRGGRHSEHSAKVHPEHSAEAESHISHQTKKTGKKMDSMSKLSIFMIVLVGALLLYNQTQISAITGAVIYGEGGSFFSSFSSGAGAGAGEKDVSEISLSELASTGHSIAALFPVEEIKTAQDAVAVMIPTGTPDYGRQLGVSYDDPTGSLSILAERVYPAMLNAIKTDEEAYQRYLNIVSKPVGISCQYCCGIDAMGVNDDGSSACGCQHNPALLGLTMWLVKNSDYTDGEIIREALKWKALFFPKDMVKLALTVAGGDTSALENLPGMVGGC